MEKKEEPRNKRWTIGRLASTTTTGTKIQKHFRLGGLKVTDLSTEVLVGIFVYLNGKQLLAVSHVCVLFRSIAEDERLWKQSNAGTSRSQFLAYWQIKAQKRAEKRERKSAVATFRMPVVEELYEPHPIKILIVGDKGVGKMAMVNRFVHEEFEDPTSTTGRIGRPEKSVKRVTILDKYLELQMETKLSLGALVCLLVYDVTCPESFNNIQHWKQEVRRYTTPFVILALVGNKLDIKTGLRRLVDSSEAQKYAARNTDMNFLEVSAKTGENIADIIYLAVRALLERGIVVKNPPIKPPNNPDPLPPVTVSDDVPKKKRLLSKIFGR